MRLIIDFKHPQGLGLQVKMQSLMFYGEMTKLFQLLQNTLI